MWSPITLLLPSQIALYEQKAYLLILTFVPLQTHLVRETTICWGFHTQYV